MTKMIQAFLMTALLAGAGALVGCGQSETDGKDVTGGDGTDQGSECTSCGPAVQGDAGSTGQAADAGTASPTADAGSAPASDAGTTPTTDAGTTPTADAGSAPASDAGTTPTTDAGTPVTHTAPVRSLRSNRLDFSDEYIGGSVCGEIRGALPGATWSSGPSIEDTDADHYLEYAPSSIAAGTYELSYVAKTCGGSAGAWADYGSRPVLLGMTADARSFVNCNWWDAATGTTLTVSSPGCNLRIAVDGAGSVTGAGNMRGYH